MSEWIESDRVQRVLITVILLNAIVLGLQTSAGLRASSGSVLELIDAICLTIFIIELTIKLLTQGGRFFRNGWNVFDLIVVGIALVPGSGPLAVLRALRVLRVLRLVSAFPQLRFIVSTLLKALPGIASIGALLCIIFYVFAVMATSLFGETFPEWFGSIGASLYSLFQIMTLESWSMGIVRPVMEAYPWAWAFFVPFILISTFTILNLFIAVIVDTMQSLQAERDEQAHEEQREAQDAPPRSPEAEAQNAGTAELTAQLQAIRAQLDEITRSLGSSRS